MLAGLCATEPQLALFGDDSERITLAISELRL
jgi:hypothetical protein